MRLNALKAYHYTADFYTPEYNADGELQREVFAGTVKLSLDTTESDNLNIDSEVPLRNGSVMRNIKDRNGDLIYPAITSGLNTGEAYVVYMERPLFSPFGTREGYSSRARRLRAV